MNDRDNQMPGSIRNFTYDSVLIGSSLAENFDTDYLDRVYGGKTLKIIKASGNYTELSYLYHIALEKHELKRVYWCLDLFALDCGDQLEIFEDGAPRYLYTKSPLDDLPYLFNREILFERIPAWLVSSLKGINTGGNAYNWAEGKDFSQAGALRFYSRTSVDPKEIPFLDPKEYQPLVDRNLEKLAEEVRIHPNTEYIFFLPPYSLLWWDSAYVNGQFEERIYTLEKIFEQLLPMKNVEIHCFLTEEDIVFRLDNYMDMIHYSPEISQLILEFLTSNEVRVTAENSNEVVQSLREMMKHIEENEIGKYYDIIMEQ